MKQQVAMVTQRIRIPATWHNGDKYIDGVADFGLGVGCCGKNVVFLDCGFGANYVKVTQITDDGESKDFYYPIATITGRVEITKK